MPVLGCGAEMAKLMDVANDDVATIEEVIAERLALGVSQAQAQRQAVDEALAQLAAERSMVMKAIDEQLGRKEEPAVQDDEEVVGDVELVFSNRVSPAQAKKLEAGKKVTLYRAMSMIDGKLYPPMSAKMTDAQGNLSLRSPEPVGVWMRSEERPDMVPTSGANAGMFPLKKPGGGTTWALYAPYFHASPIPLNDQFTAAWKNDGVERPQLVTVEVEVPASEMTSGYQAEGSVKKVGPNKWNSGVVASKVPGGREVVLSRYIKIKRVVPDAEVAQKIAAIVNPNRLSIPENTVTPQLRAELEKQGVRIAPQGTRGDDIRFSNKAQTETPEFKRWFGESVVVDAEGKPLVVYTGTSKDVDFTKFKIPKNGAWFTTDPASASQYAVENDSMDIKTTDYRTFTQVNTASRVMPVYLQITNPYTPTEEDTQAMRYASNYRKAQGVIFDKARAQGYDGVDMGDGIWVVIGKPTQVKSAIGNNGQFDPANPDIRFSNKSTIGFYSALAEEVGKINAKAQPADGWKAQIKGLIAKGAVKADEVEWTGLNDWLDLQAGKVTKEQIGEYLAANGVQVKEVVLGSGGLSPAETAELEDLNRRYAASENGEDVQFTAGDFDRLQELEQNGERPGLVKYSQYTLPGGENYREVLLTLPVTERNAAGMAEADRLRDEAMALDKQALAAWTQRGDMEEFTRLNDQARELRQRASAAEKAGGTESFKFLSSHWDQPNVLAHIRLNDRTDADGKRVLFVEEIQSDWGQLGKKDGFTQPVPFEVKERSPGYFIVVNKSDGQRVEMPGGLVAFTSREAAQQAIDEGAARKGYGVNSGVPTAPFVTKTEGWLNLALKRIMVMAAEGGYDRVAFVNGEQSANRYDLSKQVSSIKTSAFSDGEKRVQVLMKEPMDMVEMFVNKDGMVTRAQRNGLNGKTLDEVIGKDMAEKVMAAGDEKWSGLDLKVGGEGMKTFYDSIVPKATNELLRKLKTGAKLTDIDMNGSGYRIGERGGYWYVARDNPNGLTSTPFDGGSRADAERYLHEHAGPTTQPGFDVTDAMRERVDAGMPLFANKPRPAPLAEETRWQAFRRVIQDQYLPVLKVQEALISGGGTVTPQLDVYRAEERMHGRAQEKLIDFGRNLLEPLLKKAADFGIELDELAAYAYAKHAQERNAHIDQINPVMRGAGSGMDDATAQNILQMVQLAGDQAKFDDLHADLMRLTEATRQEYLRSGLISQDTYDAWTNTYDNYVPLRGFENVDDEGKARPGVGSGLSIKGKESLRAMGRRSRAADIIENIVAEHERAVLRAERNNVAKTFLALAQANPNPDLWEIQPRKLQRSFDRSRDLVVYNQAPDTTDTIGAKVGGQQVYVKVKDPLLLRSLTQAGKDKAGALHGTVVRTLGMYTNLLRNTLTRYNPVFGAINAVRDAPMGALSAYDTLGGEGAKLYAKYYAEAMAASWRHERGAPNMSKDMDRWLKEMRLAGGTTSGVYMRDVEEIKGDLRMMMLQAGATPKNLREKMLAGKPAKAAHAALHWLEIVGSTSEDAARLAAYRAAREVGKSAAEAASIAKNLTTNFNRSGEWGASINGLYLFFNAGVQGTTRLAQALTNPRVQAVLAAGVAGAAAVALANASVGGDDDDGVPYWEKIPDYEKERNLIIMLPPGVEMDGATEIGKKARYIKIPVQYGLNMFMVLGYQIADLARHVKDPARGVSPEKAAINMTSAVFGSINPFGGALDPTDPIQVGMALLPTAGDTALQLMSGTNAFGKPVGPAKSAYDTKPDSETYSPAQAGTASQRLAGWLNSVTGGNEGRSGMIDVMPGTLDNVVRNTTGGLGMFVSSLVNLPIKAWHVPENVGPKDTPLWRNLYGELTAASEVGRFYENRAKAMDELGNYEREQKLGIERTYTPKEEALQAMGESAASYNKQMSAIRKEEIEIALDDTKPEREKRLARRKLELERAALAKEYNSEFVKAMEEADRKK